MNFIKKIVDKKFDESVHLQFQKFSKGEFRNRAVINAKKQASRRYAIKTSAEFANELVRDVAEKVGSEKVKVKGAIVSTSNLKDELDFKDVKQFRGIKRYIMDKEMTGEEVLKLVNKYPKAFLALSFSTDKDKTKLKIKPKAPKTGKPKKKKDDSPKANFCTLKTKDAKLATGFVFEKPDFKEAKINHTFFVENIIISEELKKTNDFAKMREEAIRKGKIVREGVIDGNDVKSELEFEA